MLGGDGIGRQGLTYTWSESPGMRCTLAPLNESCEFVDRTLGGAHPQGERGLVVDEATCPEPGEIRDIGEQQVHDVGAVWQGEQIGEYGIVAAQP